MHQSVWTHRKTLTLAAELNLELIYAAAHLIHLWTWALDNAPDGELTGLADKVIAFGAGWTSNSETFVKAAIASGWLDEADGRLSIHDWYNYAGRLLEKKKANADRMKRARAEHVQNTCNARAGATKPNLTKPNLTKPKDIPSPSEEPPDPTPYKAIIDHLNQLAGTSYRHTANKTRDLIKARWNEGFRLEDFKAVIEKKVAKWKDDPEMQKFIRPETLFSGKFDRYVNEKGGPPGGQAQNPAGQADGKPKGKYNHLYIHD